MVKPPAEPIPQYTALIAELAAFREERLDGKPGLRALATAAGVGHQTISNWLSGKVFPQQIEPLLTLVRSVQSTAEHAGLASEETTAELLNPRMWQRAYQAEAQRRANRTSAAVLAEQARIALTRLRPGMALSDAVDPFSLEVHRVVDSPVGGLPVLPVHVARPHDDQLRKVVEQAAAGTSRIAVLVGGSSTGKTRSCWEALNLLRRQCRPWRLWHPIDPTRPEALRADLSEVAPYTVIWLNEAQLYLADHLGEQVAAGLRALLREPQRGPVLVLATLWPEHWNTLTTRADPDLHAQARELLDGHRIHVPDNFTGSEVDSLRDSKNLDPRLREAVELAPDGQITQHLAGVPVLMDRYQQATGIVRALVHAAMDARRLGAGPHLPLALLTHAAPGYLSERAWEQTGDAWLETALDYLTRPCNGIPGILIPVKTGTPSNRRLSRTSPESLGTASRGQSEQERSYRLADVLDQYGHHTRFDDIPPIAFWASAINHAHPDDLAELGYSAWQYGLYRDAAQLHKNAVQGHPHCAGVLIRRLRRLHPADARPAQWAAEQLPLDDPAAVAYVLDALWAAGARRQVACLADRAVAEMALADPGAIAELLHALWAAGAQQQVIRLADRTAADIALDDPGAVADLLDTLWWVGARRQVIRLADRAAANVPLDDPGALAGLLRRFQSVGGQEQITKLLARDPVAHTAIDYPGAVACLLDGLRAVQAWEHITALAARAATHSPVNEPGPVAYLMDRLWAAGTRTQAITLATRAATHVRLDTPRSLAALISGLETVGADEQIAALLGRDPASHVAVDDLTAIADLVDSLWAVGARDQVACLAERAASHTVLNSHTLGTAITPLVEALRRVGAQKQVTALAELATSHQDVLQSFDSYSLSGRPPFGQLRIGLTPESAERIAALLEGDPAVQVAVDDTDAVALLLDRAWAVAADDQITELLARDPAAHVVVDDPDAVKRLLEVLWDVGAEEQAMVLADRAAHQTGVDDPDAVARLLASLQAVGARDQTTALADRAASHIALDDAWAVQQLLETLRTIGAQKPIIALLARNPAVYVPVDHAGVVAALLQTLRSLGAQEQVTELLDRGPAAHAALDHPAAVAGLLEQLRVTGAHEQITALLVRDPASHVTVDYPWAVGDLLKKLWTVGAQEQVTALADRAAAHIPLTPLHACSGMAYLLDSLWEVGAQPQISALLARDLTVSLHDHSPISFTLLLERLRALGARGKALDLANQCAAGCVIPVTSRTVREVLPALQRIGAREQIIKLAETAATRIHLDYPSDVGHLLNSLDEAAPQDQVAALAERAVRHIPVDPESPQAFSSMLDSLRRIGAHEQITVLLERLPSAGLASQFADQGKHFRFGREPDGSPAAPWAWEDLD
ncbi:hypothetical protein AR457_37655 [Streptomyces agglomeratus]|uniref:hypothetical protein n=1 Tax=Streptomyces agglomeratus TaxID=285458 RepID=UPI000854706C|nr:hypothetical protein [Streptomyces agglomeratus]OEJ22940.1 hypothetical protein AR457_37655 [Streptomyces agglomeratus]